MASQSRAPSRHRLLNRHRPNRPAFPQTGRLSLVGASLRRRATAGRDFSLDACLPHDLTRRVRAFAGFVCAVEGGAAVGRRIRPPRDLRVASFRQGEFGGSCSSKAIEGNCNPHRGYRRVGVSYGSQAITFVPLDEEGAAMQYAALQEEPTRSAATHPAAKWMYSGACYKSHMWSRSHDPGF